MLRHCHKLAQKSLHISRVRQHHSEPNIFEVIRAISNQLKQILKFLHNTYGRQLDDRLVGLGHETLKRTRNPGKTLTKTLCQSHESHELFSENTKVCLSRLICT